MENNMDLGWHIVGKFKGAKEVTNGGYTNHELGLTISEWKDDFDDTKSEDVTIELPYQEEDRIYAECKDIKKGDLVLINVVSRKVRSKKNGQEYTFWKMAKESSLVRLKATVTKAATA